METGESGESSSGIYLYTLNEEGIWKIFFVATMQDSTDIELITMKDNTEDSTLIIQASNEFEEKSANAAEAPSFKAEEPLLLIPEDLPPPPLPSRTDAPQFPIKRAHSTSFQIRRGLQEVRNIITRKVL